MKKHKHTYRERGVYVYVSGCMCRYTGIGACRHTYIHTYVYIYMYMGEGPLGFIWFRRYESIYRFLNYLNSRTHLRVQIILIIQIIHIKESWI